MQMSCNRTRFDANIVARGDTITIYGNEHEMMLSKSI